MFLIGKLLGKIRPFNGVKTASILQLSATECGVASLAIIFAYYKVYIPIETLREKCGTSRDGSRASILMRVAEDYGFTADAYKFELEDIKLLAKPVIAFWQFNHYVVINGVGDERVFINDPAHGQLSVSFDEFDKAFTGIVIDISPTGQMTRIKQKSTFFPIISEWVIRYIKELTFVLICMVVVIFGPMLNSAMSTLFIDYCVIAKNINWIPSIIFVSLLSGVISTWAMRAQKLSQFRLTAKASIIKSSEIMLHMLQLPLLFYSLRQKPEISAILMRAEVVVNVLFKSLASSLISSITALVCLIFLIKLDVVLVSSLLLLSLLLFIPMTIMSRMNFSFEQSGVHALGKFYGLTLSCLKNIETLKTSGIESSMLTKWHAALCAKVGAQDNSNTTTIIINTLYQCFHSISMLMTLCIGGYRIAEGYLSVGNLMAFYALQLYFSGQLVSIFHSFKDMQNAYVSHARINDMMQYAIDERFAGHEDVMRRDYKAAISCRNLFFYYNKIEVPTLKDITLDITAGQHVALVGGTGSGKSTLVKVLCSLYPAVDGCISIYGRKSLAYSAEELARIFAYVSQDVTLFTGTIYDNLTLWRKNVPVDDVNAAIRDACLEDFILARGLDGRVEEGGHNLSGGERQRIDIARALIQKSSILILDEATSSLDTQTEEVIIHNLRRRNITIIYVAHRLSTIQHCDQIFLLEKGSIIESGSHTDLMHNKSHYCRLLQDERRP